LVDEIGPALQVQFFSQDAKSAVGGDEVHDFDPLISRQAAQQMPEKDGSAGAGGRDGQISWRGAGQRTSGRKRIRFVEQRSIWTGEGEVKGTRTGLWRPQPIFDCGAARRN